ncbi:MAG TPA: hypothetical protein VNE62_09960 [Actinomycetota bacterium]|nr:hypothetical protein [Actinomycetota bacterium]
MGNDVYLRRRATTRTALLAVAAIISGVAFAPPALAASADVQVEKTCRNLTANRGAGHQTPDPDDEVSVAPGDRIRCTIAVTNNGPDDSEFVSLFDDVPPGVTVENGPSSQPPPPEGFTCEITQDGDLMCEDPELPEGSTNFVTYVFRIPDDARPGDAFRNFAFSDPFTDDADTSNNSDAVRFAVEECEDGIDARFARRGVSITGTRGPDIICGSRFGDSINGLGGADVIFAYGGNDAVNGGTGADYIDGGTGRDALRGGPGRDRIVN